MPDASWIPAKSRPGWGAGRTSGEAASGSASGPLRIVAREFEHYVADEDVGRLRTTSRVVYADIVDLPGR